jgi:hypothetical protein
VQVNRASMLYYDLNVELLDLCAPDHLRMAAASMLTDRARGTRRKGKKIKMERASWALCSPVGDCWAEESGSFIL